MYAKIFRQIYDGTLATNGPWEALVTFQQFLVLADDQGRVDMTLLAISRTTTLPLRILAKGVQILCSPDKDSRTPAEQGRRLALISDERQWGWRIVNFVKYQDMPPAGVVAPVKAKRIRAGADLPAVTWEPLNIEDLVKEGVTSDAAQLWFSVRRRKRAVPLSPLAWKVFKGQAEKAGWTLEAAVVEAATRHWISFNAEWVAPRKGMAPCDDLQDLFERGRQ